VLLIKTLQNVFALIELVYQFFSLQYLVALDVSKRKRMTALNAKLKPQDFKLHSCYTTMIILQRLRKHGKRMFLLETSKVLIGP
jgi:hypothetical protein